MFTGLSAFPLTPLQEDVLDESAFIHLIQRLAETGVDSITALGSTGSYTYLSAKERAQTVQLAVEHSESTPVFAGIGALRTSHVLSHASAAQEAGAQALLLAPVSYQPLTDHEVYVLFRTVTRESSVPVILYDNPGTTHFTFSTELYGRIAELSGIASIKIPPIPNDVEQARTRIQEVRAVLPSHVTVGVSGDPTAAVGLTAGADAWYSVIGGTLPQPALHITRAAQQGDTESALDHARRYEPLWALFNRHGSLRVIAALAELLGLAPQNCLPLPIQGLSQAERQELAALVAALHK